jgi:hypothetical protein
METKAALPIIILSVLLFSVFVGTAQLGTVKASTTVTGAINSDTVWTKANSPYTLTGPMFLDAGVTLTIEPGTTVNLDSHVVQVKGILNARGSSSDPIHFNGGKFLFTSSSASWNEQLATGSIIENAVFTSSKIEIQDASPKIINDAFKRGSIAVIGNDPHISGGSPIISYNNIVGTTGNGSGISISGNNHATILNNLISGWNIGIATGNLVYAASSYPTIEKNVITNNSYAIKIDLSIQDYVGNNFPIIRDNTISQNAHGISVTCNWQADGNSDDYVVPTVITDNNILDNANNNLIGACTVEATGNWWGTTAVSSITDTISANYMFIPFLVMPNPHAPALDYNPNPSFASAYTPNPTAPISTSAPSRTPQNLIVQPNTENQPEKPGLAAGTIIAVAVALVAVAFVVLIVRRLYSKGK